VSLFCVAKMSVLDKSVRGLGTWAQRVGHEFGLDVGQLMFLPVDLIAFIRLRQSHAQLSMPSFVPFFDQTPENAKTKGTLEVVCTSTLKLVEG